MTSRNFFLDFRPSVKFQD